MDLIKRGEIFVIERIKHNPNDLPVGIYIYIADDDRVVNIVNDGINSPKNDGFVVFRRATEKEKRYWYLVSDKFQDKGIKCFQYNEQINNQL